MTSFSFCVFEKLLFCLHGRYCHWTKNSTFKPFLLEALEDIAPLFYFMYFLTRNVLVFLSLFLCICVFFSSLLLFLRSSSLPLALSNVTLSLLLPFSSCFLYLGFVKLPGYKGLLFRQMWKVFSHYFFRYFSLFLPSEITITQIFGCFTLSNSSLIFSSLPVSLCVSFGGCLLLCAQVHWPMSSLPLLLPSACFISAIIIFTSKVLIQDIFYMLHFSTYVQYFL